jgi:hypothetical protein
VRAACQNVASDCCAYGYATKLIGGATPQLTNTALFTIESCCVSAGTMAFPACKAASGMFQNNVQAPEADDTNWAVQDGTGFSRSVGRYTGMCFGVTINNDCRMSTAGTYVTDKCCKSKAPAFFQFKMGTEDAATGARATVLGATNLPKCKLSYGTATATARSLKRIKWQAEAAATDLARYVNIPMTFKRGQKQATICLYALDADAAGQDCSWENLCGLAGETPVVPNADTGSYAAGCELRLTGRVGSTTSACCSPTFSVDQFDSGAEGMLAASSTTSITQRIELIGH